MSRMLLWSLAVLSLFAFGGCEPIVVQTKPSYSELVTTLNAEIQNLDGLEKKRADLIVEGMKQIQADTMKSAMQAMGAAEKKGLPTNPNDLLDQAVASAELQSKLGSGLLDQLSGDMAGSADQAATIAKFPEGVRAKIAALDEQIAQQKLLVEHARAARDAAKPQ